MKLPYMLEPAKRIISRMEEQKMWKYTIQVNGMMCGMCESHVNDAVRKAFPVKKVTSSRSKKETVVITEAELDQEALRAAISATGYDVGEIRKESWQKKGLFGR